MWTILNTINSYMVNKEKKKKLTSSPAHCVLLHLLPKLWSWTIWPPAHVTIIMIIIKMISRAPIYRTGLEHRALYNNMHSCTPPTHTHVGIAVKKDSLEIVIKQVHLEGGFKRGGRIRVFEANCSKQRGQHKKMIFHQMFLCLYEG